VTAFDEFWAAFPRREKKQAARDAFAWAMKKHNGDGQLLARILDTISWQLVVQPEPRYWQMADKWLLGMRWEDEKPLTAEEQAEMVQFNAWRKANANDPVTNTITFDVFRRFQRDQRRAG
jgi:hypothetical protein